MAEHLSDMSKFTFMLVLWSREALLFPSYRKRSEAQKKASSLPKVTQEVCGSTENWTRSTLLFCLFLSLKKPK